MRVFVETVTVLLAVERPAINRLLEKVCATDGRLSDDAEAELGQLPELDGEQER